MNTSAKNGILLATLLGVLLNLLLPFFALNPSFANAAAQQELLSSTAGKVMVCTQGGLKWVALSELLVDDGQQPPSEQPSCPLCYLDPRDDEHLPVYLTASTYRPVDLHISTLVEPALPVRQLTFARNCAARAPPVIL